LKRNQGWHGAERQRGEGGEEEQGGGERRRSVNRFPECLKVEETTLFRLLDKLFNPFRLLEKLSILLLRFLKKLFTLLNKRILLA